MGARINTTGEGRRAGGETEEEEEEEAEGRNRG